MDPMPAPSSPRARLSRRDVLATALSAAAWASAHAAFPPSARGEAAPFELPPLPYERTALQPYISGTTLDYHHGKHHAGYVSKLNDLVAGTPWADLSLEEIVRKAVGQAQATAIFDNAAQVFNHDFYWRSMRAGGGGAPPAAVKERLGRAFGSVDAFREAFATAAATQFGSGWAWLVLEGDTLQVEKTGNADTPLAHGRIPLLTIDVWEHAYYLDYQNRRKDYIAAFLDHLVDWEVVARRLAG